MTYRRIDSHWIDPTSIECLFIIGEGDRKLGLSLLLLQHSKVMFLEIGTRKNPEQTQGIKI